MSGNYTPIKMETLSENIGGPDFIGIHVDVKLIPGTIWTARKYKSYVVLIRKGSTTSIRCTLAALAKHFQEALE